LYYQHSICSKVADFKVVVLINLCLFLEKDILRRWLTRQAPELTFQNTIDPELQVICPAVDFQIRQILQPFQEMKQRTLFCDTFIHKLKEVTDGHLSDVAQVYHSSVDHYDAMRTKLANGW